MSNYTEHYGLHQWEPTDNFLRADFNTDFARIDAALADKAGQADLADLETRTDGLEQRPELVTGTYTGDGTSSRVITLGFTPRAVLVFLVSGYTYSNPYKYGGIAFPDCPVMSSSSGSGSTLLAVVDGGFQVYYNGEYLRSNQSNHIYYYMVWR